MFKAPKFSRLSDLVEDFRFSYQQIFHTLLSVYIGSPIPSQFSQNRDVIWRLVKIRIKTVNEGFGVFVDEYVKRFCEQRKK
jgi:hypothetical protein